MSEIPFKVLHVICAVGATTPMDALPGGLGDAVLLTLYDDGAFSGLACCGFCGRTWRFSAKCSERFVNGVRRYWFAEIHPSRFAEVSGLAAVVFGAATPGVDERLLDWNDLYSGDERLEAVELLLMKIRREPSNRFWIVYADMGRVDIRRVETALLDESDAPY